MSVYTTVGREELAAWLKPLSVGELVAHDGISAGMQNSNYFVSTTAGRYVLTLFESLDPQALDFYLRLQASGPRHIGECPAGKRQREFSGAAA